MVTIQVDDEVWRYLQLRKNPGDSFNDVIRRELDLDGEQKQADDINAPSNVDELLSKWDPGREVDTERARAETKRAYVWLQDVDEPKRRNEITDALAAQSELSDESWWKRAVRPGLMLLADRDLVEYRSNYRDYAVA